MSAAAPLLPNKSNKSKTVVKQVTNKSKTNKKTMRTRQISVAYYCAATTAALVVAPHRTRLAPATARLPAARRRHAAARNTVGVRRVEQAPLKHRGRQVRLGARVLVQHRLVGQQGPVAVQPKLEIRRIGVPLAGHLEVIHPMQDQLDRALRVHAPERREASPRRGLILLAPEAAAEAQHVDLHLVASLAEHARDRLLHVEGALAGGRHADVSPLLERRAGPLGLQVQVLLPRQVAPALHHDLRRGEPSLDVPGLEAGRLYFISSTYVQ